MKNENKILSMDDYLKNLSIPDEVLMKIKKLNNFDLLMLLSEIDEYGWEKAKVTLEMILQQKQYQNL